ncbi:MAG: OOP family OmpA-OmpF porin, partial [Arcobacteraceae bacterium]
EITPLVGYQVKPERYVEIGDHEVFGFSVSRNSDNFLFNQLEVGLLQSSDVTYADSSLDTKMTQIFLNGLKDYKMNDNFKLYQFLGLGYERLSNEQFNNKSNPFVNYGVGVAYAFANDLSLKVDAKHQLKFGGDSSIVYTVGVSIPLAEKEKTLTVNAPLVEKEKILTINVPSVNVPSELVMLLEYKKDNIKNTDMLKLDEYVTYLNKVPTAIIVLESHTDSVGSEKYNFHLSARRAERAKEQVISMGIDENRIKIIGYGEYKPMFANDTEENRAKNRRVTVRIENK